MKIGIGSGNTVLQNLLSKTFEANNTNINSKTYVTAANPVANIKDAKEALGNLDDSKLNEIKNTVKGYDFTNITQADLALVARTLYNNNLISEDSAFRLTRGNLEFDESGQQISNKPFNALEVFSKQLKAQQDYAAGEGKNGYSKESGGYGAANKMVRDQAQATQVVFALSYFSNSNSSKIEVNEKA